MFPENYSKKHILVDTDTYITKDTKEAAYISAGGSITGVDMIMKKEVKNAFALTRPPGHHSGSQFKCSGFCFINNAALAAKYAQTKYNKKRVLVLDWDVHHGDGSAKLLEKEEDILYVSLHRYDQKNFYPWSGAVETGSGKQINIGWDTEEYRKVGDEEYIYAF